MRAVLCREWGPPESLVLEELPSPVPSANEVLICVEAATVSFANVLQIENRHQHSPERPFSPGREVVGTIKRLGSEVAGFAVGDTVLGIGGKGACCEEVISLVSDLRRVPPGVDSKLAVASGSSYATSLYALRERGRLQAGETVLILGASGGVGLAAIELAKHMGARVIACASSAGKLDVCARYGADALINYEADDLRESVRSLTRGHGVDVVYDAVGGPHAGPALRSMAWGGRYLVVGFAAGSIPEIALNLLLLKGCAIVGVWIGGLQNRDQPSYLALLDEIMAMLVAGQLSPHIFAEYSLEEVVAALNDLKYRRVIGKALVVPKRISLS